MKVGDQIILDNGVKLSILGLRFIPNPEITIGSGRYDKMWCLEIAPETVLVWLPEYRAWRICNVKLRPIFNGTAIRMAV